MITSEASPSAAPAANPTGVVAIAPDDFDRDVWCVLGVPIDRMDVPRAVIAIEAAARDGRRLSFVTPNVNWLVRASRDPAARRQILNADLSFADGAPLVAMARSLGVPLAGRTAGSDIFAALRRRPGFAGRRLRVFFFGGREGAAEAASKAIAAEAGGIESAGWLNPGFGAVEEISADPIIAAINAARPDFVVVALGASKGQEWIARNQLRLDAPVIAHLGAVVDFTAGSIARAPGFVAAAGLEWAWRIGQEPRLWRRYASDALGLVQLSLSRLAPQIVRRRRRSDAIAGPARASATTGGALRLSGALTDGSLVDVRKAFRDAARAGDDVTIDLSEAGPLDLAFLGLVLMLEKGLARKDATIRLAGLDAPQRLLFRANAMNYPVVDIREAETAGRARRATAR